jgi:hypothetical protein
VFILKKIFFYRTSWLFSINLDTNHSLGKDIVNCSNYLGPGPLQRGDNHKDAKMGWSHLKIFSRTTEPEELIFT